MPSQEKDAPRDRELVRHSMTYSESKVPMWDSSDPERAPPPLPMNPRSMSPMSPATRSNVSPNIQAVAAKFTERPSEHAPSSYTTNPMPLKSSSPERSLVKGHHHKRMQSLQPEDTRQDTRSDFMNYLENRSPERPLRATIIEAAKPRDPTKSISSPALRQDVDREMTYSLSSRYLSKPILGESTPPSATMLALQNMQLPLEPDPPSPSKPPKLIAAPFEPQAHPMKNTSMDSLSSQIHSLTDIASSLQREMMNLSRRSKDNATDLVSLKAATNARDEDIRKSLKDLSSHLTTKYLDADATRFGFSNLFKGGDGSNPKDPDSPVSKRSYSVPRMPSPNPFAFDRDSCVSPAPISDGSAALALLEKVLREMATKEGEERLLELVEEIRSRPAATASDKDADNKVTVMLEEILNLVKEDPASKALVRSYSLDNVQSGNSSPEATRSQSMGPVDPETVRALDLSKSVKGDGSSSNSDEVLAILRSVKNSVVEGGGMTNNVKSLVRELRGEVLGMGRELGRRLDEIETSSANDEPKEQPRAAGPEEISAIVNRSLDDLKEQLAATINESRQQSSDLSEFRSTMNSAAIYSVVKKALDELELPQPQAVSRGAEMDREDILETVREAWETYKPEIEFNNFGLERDEILACLEEGLKSYKPQHEQAVTYDQVLAAVEDGMQRFMPPQIEHPPSISRDEIILTIRECLEKQPEPISRSLDEEHVGHLHSMRDEILDAVSKTMASHNEGARSLDEEHVNHLYSVRDEILDAVTETMAANNTQHKSLDEEHVNQLYLIRDEIIGAVTGVVANHAASSKSIDENHASHLTSLRDEILQAVAGAMTTNSTGPRELDEDHVRHLYSIRDEILEAVTGTMAVNNTGPKTLDDDHVTHLYAIRDEIIEAVTGAMANHGTSRSLDEDNIGHLNSIRDEILGALAGSMAQSTLSKDSYDSGLGRDEIVSAVSDGLEAHFTAAKEMDEPRISRHDVMNAVNEAFGAQQSALTVPHTNISRDEILNAIADGMEKSMNVQQSALSTNVHQTVSREEIFSAIVDAIEHSRPSLSNNGDTGISRDEILGAILEGIEHSSNRQESNISRDEILNAIADGIEKSNSSSSRALTSTEHEGEDQHSTPSREEIFTAIVDGIQHSHASLDINGQLGVSKEDIMSAIAEGIEASTSSQQSALSTNVQEPSISREEILSAITEGIQNGNSITHEIELNQGDLMEAITSGLNEAISTANTNVGGEMTERLQTLFEGMKEEFKQYSAAGGRDTEQVLDAIKDGLDVIHKEIETYVVTAADLSGKDEVIHTVKEGFRLLQADMEKTITDTSLSNASRNIPDTPELLDAMEKEFEHLRGTITTLLLRSNVTEDKDEILDAIREAAERHKNDASGDVVNTIKQEFETLRERMEMSVVRAEPGAEKDEIITALREHFDTLREETSLKDGNEKDVVNTIKQELESLREHMEMSIVRTTEPASENDEIISALREHFDTLREEISLKDGSEKDVVNTIKQEFESLRERMEMSVVRAEPAAEKEEIISALREHFDILREEASRRDGSESTLSATSELHDAFTHGVDSIRDDLKKLLEKPAEFDSSEIIHTIKDGLADLKLEMDSLRESSKELDDASTARGGELMLASEPSIAPDIDGLKVLIIQLQEKIEAIETAPHAAEPAEDALKRSHLDEVLLALHEVQLAMGEMSAQQSTENHDPARKQDTDILEQLILSTKTQLDELVFPSPDQVATPEHIGTLETMIREAKDSIAEFSSRVEAEAPTKSEIGTLEGLIKDIWVILDEMKTKTKDGEEQEDPEKLLKSDLQTVEAMIFEVKTQVDELKLPDVDTLPTKAEIQELSTLVCDFREKMESNNELTAQGFDARKIEHGGLADKIDEAKFVVGELGDELKSKLDGSNEGLSELKQLLEGLAVTAESFTTIDNIKELTDLINREFERSRGEEDAIKVEKEERDAATMVKHDETRAAIIVDLGTKIDEKISEVLAKYEDAHTSLHSKFSETEERDLAHTESLTSTRSLAEDIKLVIGAMGDTVNETCERLSVDTKALMEQVDQSRQKMDDMHNDVRSHQEQSQIENEMAVAATDRVESKLLDFHPRILESVQEILTIVSQHYDHSQKSAEDFKSELSALPSTIPAMLPAPPPPESNRTLAIEDTPLHSKIDDLLEHAKNNKVHEVLSTLLDHSKNDQLHEKLDRALEQGSGSNNQIYERLNELLDHATNGSGPVHEKLDELLSRLLNPPEPDHSLAQTRKLDELLDHATNGNAPVHEKLDALLGRPLNPPEPDHSVAQTRKLDELLNHVTNGNAPVHEKLDTLLSRPLNPPESDRSIAQMTKLDELLDHVTNGNAPVHEKLDELLSRPLNPPESDHSIAQMTKLDEMHRDIMENSRRMNEMFAAQSLLVAEDTERKRREAEEAAIALERRVLQREQVEAELVVLNEEKDSTLNMIHRLRAEKEDLIKQNNKLSKDLSGLETALEIRHEEMRQMEDRADGLEKRILEGVLDHARAVLLGRSSSSQAMSLKRNRSTRSTRSSRTGARSPSVASTASTAKEPKDSRSLLGNGVGMALKRMPTSLHAGTIAVQPNIGKERRILSLSHVTGNRGMDRQTSAKSGITNLKRSHSVKSTSLRKTSWAGPTSVADKENEPFHEEDELASEAEYAGPQRKTSYAQSNAPTDRKTSYAESDIGTETERNYAQSNAGTDRRTSYAASNVGTERKTSYSGSTMGSVVTDATDQRRVSGVSSTESYNVAESSIAEHDHEDRHDDISIDGSESEDDAQTAREDAEHSGNEHQNEHHEISRQIREANEAAEAEVLKLLAPSSDSGLGTDVAV
ncbi:uncharacterized protein N7479_006891 [Penicillium vulpinum]|nr:uncharacterized protein N7479_006891 [Penicillium vulpinum]KAJ5959741.1 hypothetical protein N7479_006891 [Penicillium vulpinum]